MAEVADRRRGPDFLGDHAPVERTWWRVRLEYWQSVWVHWTKQSPGRIGGFRRVSRMSTSSDTTGYPYWRERPECNPHAFTAGGRARHSPVRPMPRRRSASRSGVPLRIRASARPSRKASGCAAKPLKMLGQLRGLDVLILAAGRGQPVSALTLVLPCRDQTGLVCGDQRRAIRWGRIDGHRSWWNHDLCPLSCHDGRSLARSPSCGGLVACPLGWLNRHVTGSVRVVANDGPACVRPAHELHRRLGRPDGLSRGHLGLRDNRT